MDKLEYRKHIYALIPAGGGGTRLWPCSTEKNPKQFLKLFGEKTLIQITADRLNKFIPWEKIYIITTTEDYGNEIRRMIPEIPSNNVIVEPMRRDTAPAHSLGALYIYHQDKDAVIVNAAADHFISPVKNYKNTMLAASNAAYNNDWLIAVGIQTTYPHTGLGYIKRGEKIKTVEGKIVYKLDKFTEKPELEVAKQFVSSPDYFWNASHYVWRADTFLNAVKKYAPEISMGMDTISQAFDKDNEKEVIKEVYEKLPKISVDYAVSEKADNFVTITADYNWTDIGDWNEVWKNLDKDDLGNVIIKGDNPNGEVMYLDTSDTLIRTDGRTIAVIDVDNIVVVDTKDALLICSKSHSQNVKKIVERLKEMDKKELL
jgi:mannose-1-phosphate guanylyltransferase